MERFTTLEKSDQASVRWRIGNSFHRRGKIGSDQCSVEARNDVNNFIVARVLSGLDKVRIEFDVRKLLQGLRIGKKIQVRASI